MDTGKIRNQYDETLDSTQPLPVIAMQANEKTAVSETLTYNGKAAAGAVTINSTTQKPIMSVEGDQVASHWELKKNQVYKAVADALAKAGDPRLTSVTETNGSAAVVINDADRDLELLYESLTTTVKRYVIKVTDKVGGSLYGWIFGVAKSGNVYTIDVVNNRLTETQNWVGTLASFDNTNLAKVEIFRYNSPLTFATGTTLTEEVVCPREYSKSWQAAMDYAENLTNGQYFVDYLRGRIIGKKADGTASETIGYTVVSSVATAGAAASEFTDDAAFTPGTSKVVAIGGFADETATDSVNEGDVGAVRMTLDRQLRVAPGSAITGVGNPVVDSYQQVAINLAAGADQVLVASAPSKQIWVYGYHFMVNVAGTVSFQDEDNTAISGIMQFGITGGASVSPSGNFAMPIWKLATDKDLEVDVVTSELDGWLAYAIISV